MRRPEGRIVGWLRRIGTVRPSVPARTAAHPWTRSRRRIFWFSLPSSSLLPSFPVQEPPPEGRMNLDTAVIACGGTALGPIKAFFAEVRVTTDTRTLAAGDWFLALE